jgi:hypothetical protein
MKWLLIVVLLAVLGGVVMASARGNDASRRTRGRTSGPRGRAAHRDGDPDGYRGSSYDDDRSGHHGPHGNHDGGADAGADGAADGGADSGGGGGD